MALHTIKINLKCQNTKKDLTIECQWCNRKAFFFLESWNQKLTIACFSDCSYESMTLATLPAPSKEHHWCVWIVNKFKPCLKMLSLFYGFSDASICTKNPIIPNTKHETMFRAITHKDVKSCMVNSDTKLAVS